MDRVRTETETWNASRVIYETVRQIKGRPPKKIPISSENDQIYATVPEVAENFTQTFQQVSANDNYGQEFLIHKNAAEQETICFDSPNAEPCNRPFTVEELEFNLSRTKNTTPGNDGVHYQMLKKMPLEAKQYLCKIFNKLWQLSYFPSQWTTVIIVTIHKPGIIALALITVPQHLLIAYASCSKE